MLVPIIESNKYKNKELKMENEPIRVLNLFTIMNRGGAETMVMNYYRKIDRTKVQFDFLVHRTEKGAYDDEIRALGGKIYYMCPIYPQNFNKYKKDIKKFFNEHKEYKIIHSHMSELGYFALKEAAKQNIPVRICHAHNTPTKFDLKMIIRTYFKKAMLPYITDMFTCSKDSGIWLFGKKNENRLVIMKNAIDAEKYRYNKEKEEEIRKQLHLEKKYIVGHVGRFNKQKNHEFLIRIFKEICNKRDDAVLILVGKGNEEEKIRKIVKEEGIKDRVIFYGETEKVYEIMQVFDSFVFPSLFEGLGIVLIEAQAAGIQCFTSKDTVPEDVKITELLEYISLNKQPDEWADEILKKKIEKKDMFEEIKKNGFDIYDNVKWLENMYLSKLEKE